MTVQHDYLNSLCEQIPYPGIAVAVMKYAEQFEGDSPAVEMFQDEIKRLLDVETAEELPHN